MNNKLPKSSASFLRGRGRLHAEPRARLPDRRFPRSFASAESPRRSADFPGSQENTLMATRSRLLAALATICFGGLVTSPQGASANLTDTFSGLAGRWSGQGTVKPATGPAERFNCVVTYIPQGSSTRLRQNLRCNSANYRLDAATHLELRGGKVVGR